MDQFNSVLQYLRRKQHEKDQEHNASSSGADFNIDEHQRDGGHEGESNVWYPW